MVYKSVDGEYWTVVEATRGYQVVTKRLKGGRVKEKGQTFPEDKILEAAEMAARLAYEHGRKEIQDHIKKLLD
jgi:hypothetical protein